MMINCIIGVFFLALPFILMFSIVWKIDGFKFACMVFGGGFTLAGFIILCAKIGKYFWEGCLF